MRRPLSFSCDGATLAATLDEGAGETGLLIVSGGNEIRSGAHRGMAKLAAAVAALDHPVFRFDRRGVGDSEGENGSFASSGPDIAAAAGAFRAASPHIRRIIAFGNCDAATALVVHRGAAPIDALVLANPWVVEPVDDLPPPAAIRDRYAKRLRDPEAWAALLTGKIDMRALARGLGRIATPATTKATLADAFAEALSAAPLPTTILLATGDGTAIAFENAWRGKAFDALRGQITVNRLDSPAHSFSNHNDFNILMNVLKGALRGS